MFLKNRWYVAALTDEVNRKPLGRMIIGEPVVLYRTEGGEAIALQDRCCHRRVPLHPGELVGDAIQCPYHGFLFNQDGACTEMPGQESIPAGAGVRRYSLCERHRWIWIWMGDPALADEAAIPDFFQNDDPGWAATGSRLPVDCDYLLFVDNLLDLSHVAYVHAATIGSDDSRAEITFEREDEGVRVVRRVSDIDTPPINVAQGFGTRVDQSKIMTFWPPAHISIEITTAERPEAQKEPGAPKGIHIMILNCITPETATTCHYFWASTRDFDIENEDFTRFMHDQTVLAFDEDKVILEAQQRYIDMDPAAPQIDVRGDAGGLHARKVVGALLDAEGRAAAEP